MDMQALWLSQYPGLVRYLKRYTHSSAEAEDLAQTTFVRAMEHLPALSEMSQAHAQAWLMRTARNAFIDEARKASRQLPLDEAAQPAYEEDFTGIHVAQWLEKLPPQLREVVTLRHLEGYNSAQIGQALNVPPATVRTRLRAAMILLRQYEKETSS